MQNRKGLGLQIAGAIALAMLFGTSAFAESRHQSGTSRGSGGNINRGGSSRSSGSSGSYQPRARSASPSPQRFESRGNIQRYESRGNAQRYDSRNDTPRYDSRSNIQRDYSRGNAQRYDSRGNTPRYDSRSNVQRDGSRGNIQRDYSRGNVQRDSGWRGNTGRGGYTARGNAGRGNVILPRGTENDRFHHVEGWHGGAAPYRPHERVTSYGRVDRYERWHGGYRVWIGGGLYPIWVPFSYWARFPLHVGLFIRFGGFWDPFGYWSVYDYAPYYGSYYDPYYYDRGVYTSGTVHGVVESIDYRRGTLVLNDDISHQFVTVDMPRDRQMNDIRPGDYVEFSGDWSRSGYFDAYRLERWDYGRDNRDYGRDDRDDGYNRY